MTNRLAAATGLSALILSLSLLNSPAALYQGNGENYYGGIIGDGTMSLTASGDTINGLLTRGGAPTAQFNNYLVIYIDSVPGGFADTTAFGDYGSIQRQTISGFNGGMRASAFFAGDFRADYAMVLNPDVGCALFQLASGGAGSLVDLTGTALTSFNPRGELSSPTFTFSFRLSDLGLSAGSGFRFQSIYSNSSGSRTLESFEQLTGTGGWGTINFSGFNSFPEPVPETTNAALAVFGGLVLAGSLLTRLRRQ